ncbi:MAG: SDR family NAD(P)-dependent oxidoreductase [Pirellulaceae bacterium]|jgi:UDP-glucose 4-epimerase|nr:SDR family NAD(P)-dependent oxidoreductase [Pirellulaceae bacterium]
MYLVTGGAGFIGSHIATALVRRGERVRVLDNLSTGTRANLAELGDQVEFLQGDVAVVADVRRALQGVTHVFHQAALASVPRSVEYPLDSHAACVTGTVTLLDEARRAGVRRVVYAGSSSAYGDRPFTSKRETDLPDPLSPYAAAKLGAEMYCRAFYHTYGLSTVTVRYFNVFGPRQDPASPYSAVIPLFITALLRGERPTIYGDGRQSRDFSYVENVVQGNLLAMDSESDDVHGACFNVADGQSTTLLELLAALSDMLGTRLEPCFAPPRAGDVRESMADISLARKVLGYEPPVSFREGLQRSIAYYRGLASGRTR